MPRASVIGKAWNLAANRANLVTRQRGAAAAMQAVRETYPPLFRRHARRPRLTRLLDASRSQTILITAPAGYGKTTLAHEWVQGRDDVVWYRATAGAADVAAFSAGIADVVAALVPGAGERLKQRLRVADTPERAARPLAEILSEDLESWPEDALLIIDDYHLVADSAPVEEFMDWLLMLTPVLRVLVTSRRRPKWASARRILYGEITEIGREQLAMTTEEAAPILDRRSTEDVRRLVEQAEGWPALIGLAALAATDEIPAERVSDALFRYFAEEVVKQEPDEVGRFMLLASIPTAIDTTVAQRVLGVDDPESTFDRLIAEGLLEPIGDQFRFHPLLRSFLQKTLETEDPVVFRQLTGKTIEAARTAEHWDEAFDLAVQIDELSLAADVLEQATPDLLAAGRTEALERWLNDLKEVGVDHPGAVMARAELLIRQGRWSEAGSLARSVARQLPPTESRLPRAWYLAGLAAHLASRAPEALECHLLSRENATTPHEISDAMWGAYIAAQELGAPDASQYLAEMASLNLPDPASRLRLATGQMGICMTAGSLIGAEEIFRPLIPLVEHAHDPMASSSFLARAADIQVIRAHYADALRYSERALEIASDLQLEFAVGLCLVPRAAAEIGLRRFAAARKTLREMHLITLSRDDPYLEVAILVAQLRLRVSQSSDRFADVELPVHIWERVHVAARAECLSLRALSAAAAGNAAMAVRAADEADDLSTEIASRFLTRFARVLAAGITEGWGRPLERAAVELVGECSEAEAYDSIVLACRAEPRIASASTHDPSANAVVGKTLSRTGDKAIARQAGLALPPDNFEGPLEQPVGLTPREQEVLVLLMRGLSNREIASELVISPSTVKVHVHHVLEKLNVQTRLQAVVKARAIEESMPG